MTHHRKESFQNIVSYPTHTQKSRAIVQDTEKDNNKREYIA